MCVSNEINTCTLIPTYRKSVSGDRAVCLNVDAVALIIRSGDRTGNGKLRQPCACRRQREVGVEIVFDYVPIEGSVGIIQPYTHTGRIFDGIAAEIADAEIHTHCSKEAAVDLEIGQLDMGSNDPETCNGGGGFDRGGASFRANTDNGQL